MARKWYDGQVVRIEEITETTWRFWVEILEEETFDFKPGQFMTMDLPIHEKRNKRWRSYSIASAPDGKPLLEFCIVRLEGGLASDYFFEAVKVGTPILFKGPLGKFTLPDEIHTDLVFICTGTGVAPFRSMMLDFKNRGVTPPNIHLIFGTRYQEAVLYQSEFEALIREFPQYRYSVTLSREPELNASQFPFPFYHGYVHQVYLKEYSEVREDLHFYLCGWKNMIDDAVGRIKELGYDRKQIHYELYG